MLYDESIQRFPEWLQRIQRQVSYGILYDSCLLYRQDGPINFRPYSHQISDLLDFLYYMRTEENYRRKTNVPYFTLLRDFIISRKQVWKEMADEFVDAITCIYTLQAG